MSVRPDVPADGVLKMDTKLVRTTALVAAFVLTQASRVQAQAIDVSSTVQRATMAEQSHPPLTFDVASVKQVDISKLGDLIAMDIGTVRRSELTFDNVTLNDCIRFAYGVTSNSQIDGPDWIRSKKFLYSIDARFPHDTTREQLQAMMQTLLVERFKLVIHRERKSLSHYSLVTAKGGIKMESVEDVPLDYQGITNGGYIDSILSMTMLANLLARFETELPVVDGTGKMGMFRVKLQWSLREAERVSDTEQGASLVTALQEQLGLRLVHQNDPIDVFSIESVEKIPTQN
jgi:uncharacterized protein (TIGR03435 family)